VIGNLGALGAAAVPFGIVGSILRSGECTEDTRLLGSYTKLKQHYAQDRLNLTWISERREIATCGLTNPVFSSWPPINLCIVVNKQDLKLA
jgi:hypothetical protein